MSIRSHLPASLPLRRFTGAALALTGATLTLIFATSASAQTTYQWIGTQSGANAQWQVTGPTLWEDLTAPLNPAANPPGSLLNGSAGAVTNDAVIIKNNRAADPAVTGQSTQQVRIQNVDVGRIESLQLGGVVGGVGTAPPFTGNWATQLQVRGNNGNISIGTLTLGAMDLDQDRRGQFLVNNAGSSATVDTVVSGSTDGGNIIIVSDNAAGGFTLNGNIDTTGTREIDFRIQANDDVNTTRVVLGTGGQLLSVDSWQVGYGFSSDNTGSFTLNAANVVEANEVVVGNTNGNTMNSVTPRTVTGALTIDGGASVDAPGTSGQNGNIRIGYANMADDDDQIAQGTINVEQGTLATPNILRMGQTTVSANSALSTIVSTGVLNLNQADSAVTVGRISDANSMLAGGLNIGEDRTGTGTININAGLFNSYARVYIGGDDDDGADRSTSGTINVNSGGTLYVGNKTAADLTFDGNPRAIDTSLGNANVDVGRDGTGFLNVNGGELTLFRGNLILGQNGDDTQNIDTSGDGTNDAVLEGLAIYDAVDELNQLLIDQNPANGDITLAGGSGPNYVLTAQGIAKVNPNISRGTVVFSNGANVTIGVTQGPEYINATNTSEVLNDLNFNNGGGDLTQSDSSVTIERDLNMGTVDPGQARNSYIISGSSTLDVGRNAQLQASDFTVSGDAATITVGNNLNLDSETDFTFDFEGQSTVSALTVDNNVNLNDAELFLANTAALSVFSGDIALFIAGNSLNGVFGNITEGQTVGAYQFTYLFDTGMVDEEAFGLVQIPEPSTLTGLCLGLGLLARRSRRRRS